jgi:DNA replication protein
MKRFNGFPARMEFTPLPNLFFSSLLPQIIDMSELKTTLHVLAAIYRKRGFPRFVTFSELLGDASLMSSLKGAVELPDQVLRRALEMAAGRGTFLHVVLDRGDTSEDVYLLNDESSRQAVSKIESGELKLAGLKVTRRAYVEAEEQPNVYKLYEDNIGLLTPMVADEIREAEKLYPPGWIREAIKEAVLHNKRNIRYIVKILESWAAEGKKDGAYQRDTKKTDPDKYIKGKYGHMVRR